MLLKLFYTLFLALLVALFVGLGIDAFYPGPQRPDYPTELEFSQPACPSGSEDVELKQKQKDYSKAQDEFNDKSKSYNRNVSIISLISGIIILIVSLTFFKKIKMIADGILLGGVFTSAYSIIRGLMSEDTKFRFLIVTAGLIIALILGYIKFIKPKEQIEE